MVSRLRLTALLVVVLLFAAQRAMADKAPFVGLEIQDLTPTIAAALDGSIKAGVMVRDVSMDGPGVAAGIRRGDIIVAVDGKKVGSIAALVKAVLAHKIGDAIEMTVLREGKSSDLSLTLAEKPAAWGKMGNDFGSLPAIGLTLSSLSEQVRKQFDVRWASRGVVITIAPTGSAQAFKRGDVIVQIDQKPVWEPAQVIRIIQEMKAEGREAALFLIDRQGAYHFVVQPFK